MDEFHSLKSTTMEEDDFHSTLHSAPSFAIYNNSLEGYDNDPQQVLMSSGGGGDFSFGGKRMMDLIDEGENEKDEDDGVELQPPSPPMYLAVATGLGFDGTGFDEVVGSHNLTNFDMFDPNLQESGDLEDYCERMVDEYPCHPLVLKKYAQLLQSKGDLEGAEEYFLRATQADPDDGEILMQYAKLVWEHHHDKDTASVYFERAAQAAPHDSHVLAAYTSFLWETEDNENDSGKHEIQNDKEKPKTEPAMPSKEESDPDYFKRMIDENPNNPLFLKKYAQFLFQSKRDLQAAEDYYSRAILADPSDGEMISEYATLEWELHRDQEKASRLFEQAVQATPGNSNILAAYACFLWETEDEES